MLMPAEVIRRAERFKSSTAITPHRQTPATCTETRGVQPRHIAEPEGTRQPRQRPWQTPARRKGLLKDKTMGFPPGVWRRTRFSLQRFFCPFLPTHLTTTTASALRPSTWPLTICVLPGDVPAGKSSLMGGSPRSARAQPFRTLSPRSPSWRASANCCCSAKASSAADLRRLPRHSQGYVPVQRRPSAPTRL